MSANVFRVFHLNRYVRSFPSHDAASLWVYAQPTPEDYEILDKSDELAGN